MLKFDGVSANKDKELEDPEGYTVIEHAYALMAADARIEMSECRLFEENGRRHFMTRRFDRLSDGGKLHMQSLAALAGVLGSQRDKITRTLRLQFDRQGVLTSRHRSTGLAPDVPANHQE